MKQTAVEWLYETLWKQTDFSLPSNILDQAKAMEKQQIIDAHGIKTEPINQDQSKIITGRQYYNETFNK